MSLIWIDLETSGLDPKRDVILAFGVKVTDLQLNTIAETEHHVYYSKEFLRALNVNQYVKDMHTRSGLWDRVFKATLTAADIIPTITQFLRPLLNTGTLAGNSVHFDRSFLAEQSDWPRLQAMLSHRHLDVSVFKVLEPIWGIPQLLPSTATAHTPLADLEQAIRQLRAVGEWVRNG